MTPCIRCQEHAQAEVFLYHLTLRCTFEIGKAKQLVADGRWPLIVDDDAIRHYLKLTQVQEEHIGHVDPTVPGLLGTIPVPDLQGGVMPQIALIDGHHRAARCLREGKTFYAYQLTAEETADCLRVAG